MSNNAADAYREQLKTVSNREFAWAGFSVPVRYWPLAALSLLLVWLLERSIGGMVFNIRVTSGPDAIASIGVMTVFVVVAGLILGVISVGVGRLMAAGRLPVDSSGPAKFIHPAWWLRFLFRWSCSMLVCHLGFAAWRYGYVLQGVPETIRDRDAAETFTWFMAIFLFVTWGGYTLLECLAPRLRNFLQWARSSVVMWGTWSVLSGAWTALGFGFTFIGACLVAQPTFAAFGLGSPLNLVSMTTSVLLAIGCGWWCGRDTWSERSIAPAPAPSQGSQRTDFWNWDMDAETSASGVAANGYPFFIWRESADDRLGLSRPRYCCILKEQGELNLAFFNPSDPVLPTGGWIVGGAVGALVALAMITGFWVSPPPPAAYVSNTNPPAFLRFLSVVFASGLACAASGSLWYACVTLVRWYWNRFAHDGGLRVRPLRTLAGFNLVDAGAVGAQVNGEKAKTGHGLTAVFEDGSMWILTANAWEYPTAVAYHSILTNAFREPRDRYLIEWDAQKQEIERSMSREQAVEQSVPQSL